MTQHVFKMLLTAGLILPIGAMQTSFSAEQKNTQSIISDIHEFIQQEEKKVPEKEIVPQRAEKKAPEKKISPQQASTAKPTKVEKNNPPPAKATVNHVEYKVPCLTVRRDGSHGKISYLPLKFTRTKEDKPLRIMIADDTPNGSGKTIHNSVWLAAVTAAMLRNDTMHGTTISVEFSGNVDGPSAGGVTCLAILSAIDGLPLPNDFAMTGTILPDGTIGVVGGVPEKMRAAAKSGKKRIFIPAFLRFEKNSKGENVDLQRLADELKVKLYRVENIGEAYAVLHGKPYSGNEYVNVRDITRLPQATEDVLTATYQKYHKAVLSELSSQNNLLKRSILPDYVLSPDRAQQLYNEGKLLPATLQIFHTWQTWQAWKKAEKFLNKFYSNHDTSWLRSKHLREYHYRKILLALRQDSEKYMTQGFKEFQAKEKAYFKKHYSESNGFLQFKTAHSEFAAQLESVESYAKLWGRLQTLYNQKVDEKTINIASENNLDEYWDLEIRILRIYHLLTLPSEEYNNFLEELASTLPPKKANKRAVEVERLFYSAYQAADHVTTDNMDSIVSGQNAQTRIANEIQRNPYLMPFYNMRNYATLHHLLLTPNSDVQPTCPAYHLQGSLKTQVSVFAMASALMVMYGPDRSLANDFIPHLLRNARSAAIRNISECVKAGIPCVAAIYDFEMAESANGRDNDNVEALMAYWRASLYAKALLMSFN